jgi:hypothetical protein
LNIRFILQDQNTSANQYKGKQRPNTAQVNQSDLKTMLE